jgi:DNA-binding MarR family transcriptional regulator
MVDTNNSDRERELNAALEAIHFGFRALTARPDAQLAGLGYSRVHHRILFFVGRNPECSIRQLLGIMRVTKQYLHLPLQRLIEDKYILVRQDPADRRVKRLVLSKRGATLEAELSGDQRHRFQHVFEKAGPQAEAGWRKVMALLVETDN